ncbi:MAG TPA: SidA/IucD/PvdA family monooxygenase [Candidatus Nanopelagicales bacterium]|nr:SidA/IucD/PvdA family monooxygenase [Candidatus Nanopelagicales bacterium]
MDEERLMIIGAGPKAIAVAAKAHVLAGLGLAAPRVHIVERKRVGANWTGESGYTNGTLQLGTSPEKDIGFPYDSTCWAGEEVNRLVNARMTQYSWQSYLIESKMYSDWVDRGRPAPEHRRWAAYLQWVAARLEGTIHLHRGDARRLSIKEGRWVLAYRTEEGLDVNLEGDGLMLTGPGRASTPPGVPESDRVLTIEGFWRAHKAFQGIGAARIAVVGAGESAAAIAMELAFNRNQDLHVDVISPMGMTYSRGESYRENRLYSNPEHGRWRELSEQDRRRFIHRTDRGVFSLDAVRTLDRAERVDILPGRLRGVTLGSHGAVELQLEYNQLRRTHACDYAIMAMGYDHLAPLRDMLDEGAQEWILRQAGVQELTDGAMEPLVDRHFEVHGLRPRLHLPMLSRLTQGPGFANLSCLGRLSDSLLTGYVTQADRRPKPERRPWAPEPTRPAPDGGGASRIATSAPPLPILST